MVITAKKENNDKPDWHPNKDDLTFEQVMAKVNAELPRDEIDQDYIPTIFSNDPIIKDKVKKEWLEDPVKYRR